MSDRRTTACLLLKNTVVFPDREGLDFISRSFDGEVPSYLKDSCTESADHTHSFRHTLMFLSCSRAPSSQVLFSSIWTITYFQDMCILLQSFSCFSWIIINSKRIFYISRHDCARCFLWCCVNQLFNRSHSTVRYNMFQHAFLLTHLAVHVQAHGLVWFPGDLRALYMEKITGSPR